MSPTFDPAKNAANVLKHGVSLSEGDGVLNDPLARTVEADRGRIFEPRRRYSIDFRAASHTKRATNL
jgi:uncharacterized DUF497 family protein